MAEAAKKERKIPTILAEKLNLAESVRRDWVVEVPANTHSDDITHDEFWTHCAEKFSPFDTIEVRWEDGSKIANLRVVFARRSYCTVHLANVEEFGEVGPHLKAVSNRYKEEWSGPAHRWRVRRLSDQKVMAQDMDKDEAIKWIADNDL